MLHDFNRRNIAPILKFTLGGTVVLLLSFWVLALGGDPVENANLFYERTFAFQSSRENPFTIFDRLPALAVLHLPLTVAAIILAFLVAVVPKKRTIRRLAAFSAALIIVFELTLLHWFHAYIIWFEPFVFVALLLATIEKTPLRGKEQPAISRRLPAKWSRWRASGRSKGKFLEDFVNQRSHSTSNRRGSSDKASAAPPWWRKLSSWWRLRSDFGWALSAVVLTSLSMALIMRLWRADLWMPFNLEYDAPEYLMIVKGILVHGWWLENPDLGAPFGQELYDFPLLANDGLHLVLIKLLSLFSSDPVFVANLFFFLSFPLVALTSFLVLRQLGISGAAALVCSVLYALAPYHFLRDHLHLNLAAYYSVPVGAYLILSILSGKRLFARRTSAGPSVLTWVSRRSLVTLVLCLFVASASSTYYAVFAILLLIATMMLVVVTRRDARTLLEGGAVVGLILGFLALASLPHLIYWHINGPNYAVAHRGPSESESFGLVLTKMLLPVPGHPIDALSTFAERYLEATPLKTEYRPYQSLGFIAALGFVWLLLVALAGCLSPRWGIGDVRQRQLHRRLAAVTVIAFLIGTTGGISSLFAWLVSPQIRSWERISIFISFFALAAVALLLDALQERVGLRGGRPVLAGALIMGVLMLGLYDLSNGRFVPDYESVQNKYTSDALFVEEIDSELPPKAEVFQLPYIPFPEHRQPDFEMGIYEPLRPYLHSSDLRWSYGAVKGRPSADWQTDLADKPTEVLLDTVSDKGFDGIYIDRFGYPDRAAKLEGELGELLEVEPLISPDGRKSFFSLLSYKEKTALQR